MVSESNDVMVAAIAFFQGSQPRWVLGQSGAGTNVSMPLLWVTGTNLSPSCGGSPSKTNETVGTTQRIIANGSSTTGAQSVYIQIPGGGTWNRSNIPMVLLTEP